MTITSIQLSQSMPDLSTTDFKKGLTYFSGYWVIPAEISGGTEKMIDKHQHKYLLAIAGDLFMIPLNNCQSRSTARRSSRCDEARPDARLQRDIRGNTRPVSLYARELPAFVPCSGLPLWPHSATDRSGGPFGLRDLRPAPQLCSHQHKSKRCM
jgi:hypothetical protein